MKNLYMFAVCIAVFLLVGIGYSFAAEIDMLVNKLVEKGVLTPGEGQQLIVETKEEAKKDLAKGTSPSVPQWAQNIKLKGDLRTRFQWEDRKGKPTTGVTAERQRARVRLRLGAEAKVTDKTKVYFGLASGSDGDPRSTNQTFQDTFAKKPVWIDYAYFEYVPLSWATLYGGRMKNIMYQTGDIYWDTDINPEGLAASFTYKPREFKGVELFLNAPLYLLNELNDGVYDYNDPFIWAVQPGLKWDITDKIGFKGSFNYYDFINVKDRPRLTWYDTRGCNTFRTDANGTFYIYDYNVVGGSAELGMKEPFGSNPIIGPIPWAYIPYVGGFGDVMDNTASGVDAGLGWLFGGKLGYEKVGKKGDWQISANYRRIESDAWLDALPDSDAYGGATGAKGFKGSFQYALLDNVTLGFNYFNSSYIKGFAGGDSALSKRHENLYQVDCVFKF